MNDTNRCPICFTQLKIYKNAVLNGNQLLIKKICHSGLNHVFSCFTDPTSKNVVFVKFSLNNTYSFFTEIDYDKNSTVILGIKNSKESFRYEIPKIIEADFPKLEQFKEKIKLYVSFS